MSSKFDDIPIVHRGINFLKGVRFSFLEGYSLFDLLQLYILGIVKGAFSYRAGSIAFSFFMALFPFALFILNLIPYIPLDNFQVDFLEFIKNSLPPNTYEAVESILKDIMNNSYKSLLSSGFFLSIFLMSNGVFAILGGFESSYHITISRNMIRQYLVALVLSIGLSFALIFSVAVYVVLEIGLYKFHVDKLLILGARNVYLLLVVFLTICILYKFGAKQTKKIPFISIGSVFTTVLYILTSYFFGVYVLRFARYNELYGSIGTLLVMMFYLWINCMILLLGFELNAAISKLKQKNNSI